MYDTGYNPTQRHKYLTEGKIPATSSDINELWNVFVQGSMDAGVDPLLPEFCKWVLGIDEFEGEGPASVVW